MLKKIRAFFKRLTRCPICDRWSRTVERRRLNTAYQDEADNYMTSCQGCYDDTYKYFEELWQDYYNSR